MQKMRSARKAASRRSCVTRMMVTGRAACRSRITHHSSSRVKLSSAPNGSSSISSCGSWISARQSEARCCMPPDSSQGYLAPMPVEAHLRQQRLDLGDVGARSARRRLRCGCTISSGSRMFSSVRAPGQQVRRLERHAGDLERPGRPSAADRDAAGLRKLQPGHQLHQGRLAAARRADDGGELALADRQRQLVDSEHAALPAVGMGDVLDVDEAVTCHPGIAHAEIRDPGRTRSRLWVPILRTRKPGYDISSPCDRQAAAGTPR